MAAAAAATPRTPEGGGSGTPGGGGGGSTPARLTGGRPPRPGVPGRGGGGAGSRASAFKQQLGGLVRSMAATRCHYVRCVNPRAAAASALQGKPPPPPPPTAGLHSATADRVARDRAGGVPTVPTAAETETEMDMEVVEQLAAAAAGLEQEFDAPRVLAQLQALGTLQAVQMARHGYPDL